MLKKLLMNAGAPRIAFLLLVVLAAAGCRKDGDPLSTDVARRTPDELKAWFRQNSSAFTHPDNWMNTLTPNWNDVYAAETEDGTAYEIGLHNPGKLFVTTARTPNAEEAGKYSEFRLVLMQDDASGSIRGFVMSVLNLEANPVPLHDIHGDDAGAHHVRISYYTLDGNLYYGNTYKNGIMINRVGRGGNGQSPIRGKVALANPDCQYEQQAVYGFVCISTGSMDDPFISKICKYQIKGYDEMEVCPEGTGGGGPPNNYPPQGSTGSAGSAITTADITDSLDAYPCAKDLVTQLPSLKNDIAAAIKTTFATSSDFHMRFLWTDTLGANVDGVTYSSVNLYNGYNYSEGWGTLSRIAINKDVLAHATKEYMLAVMYHEALHAFLFAEKHRLVENFSSVYPDVNPDFVKQKGQIDISKAVFTSQHATMGVNFVNKLSAAIQSFNPNIGTARANALASAGILAPKSFNGTLNGQERDTRLNQYAGTKCP